jgi:hypothetical protein
MTWKDILKQDGIEKAPFGRFRRNKTSAEPKLTDNQKMKIENVKKHMAEIISAYKKDPEFQKNGKFAIKVVPENFTGRGRKGSGNRKLIWEMQQEVFGDANFVQQHGIPVLEQFGFKVERMGDMIQASKGNPNVQGKFGI